MTTVYAVSTIPVRDTANAIVGWVRGDLLADGSRPTDLVYLRDGSAHGQADAIERIRRDPGLLYPTRAEAVQAGIAKLRAADARGDCRPLRRSSVG